MTSSQLRKLFKTSVMAIACTAMLTPASAITVYKSIGEFGEVKYSQFPPQSGKDVEVIELRSNGRQAQEGQYAGKTSEDMKQEDSETAESTKASAEEKRIEELEKQTKEKDAQLVAQRCQTLRNNLASLNTAGRKYVPDGKGGKKYLDDRETDLERERVQKLLDSYCSGQTT